MISEHRLRKSVEALGGKLEKENNGYERIYQAVAPRGFHWKETAGPHLIAWRDDEGREDLAERVGLGLEKCWEDCDCWFDTNTEG